ncbi:hypothetical protein [uncultured Microscilla sp.]|uniref:hypothetical protein n=1 Tax=uncultured Microscilla sp. TaxID=432653 RepID=UPI00261BD646|nr:hypothetical protein [uncultured Microscilla sp.]
MNKIDFTKESFTKLDRFMKQNAGLNLATANLKDAALLDGCNWNRLKRSREALITQLKAYQRLHKIVPEGNPAEKDRVIKALLGKNIHSSLQIASMPRQRFIREYLPLFDGQEEQILETYQNALTQRSQVLLQYMHMLQSNEPHMGAARM